MEGVPNSRLTNKIWSYVPNSGMLDEHTQRCVSSWRNNCPRHDIHVVDAAELRRLVPDDYLPTSFSDEPGTAGVALLRAHGGTYLDPHVLLNRPLDWAHKSMDAGEYHFIGVCGRTPAPDVESGEEGSVGAQQEDDEELVAVVLSAPRDSPLIKRLGQRMVRKDMNPEEAFRDLKDSDNNELISLLSKKKVRMFDAEDVLRVFSDPEMPASKLKKGGRMYLMPEGAGRGTPGSAVRHLWDTNSEPGVSPQARELAAAVQPEKPKDEKTTAGILFISLAVAAGALLYHS